MKGYHIFFILLRVLVIIQLFLVICKKQPFSPEVKIIIDTVLKLSIGIFIIIFFYFNHVGLDYWDVFILQFSGIVIILDIDYVNLLKIIKTVFPHIGDNLDFLTTIQRYPKNHH